MEENNLFNEEGRDDSANSELINLWFGVFDQGNRDQKIDAVKELVKLSKDNPRKVTKGLCEALKKDPKCNVRYEVVCALGAIRYKSPEVVEVFLGAINDDNSHIAFAAIKGLGEVRADGPKEIGALTEKLNHKSDWIKCAAAWTLVKLGQETPKVVEILLEAIRHENSHIAAGATRALGRIKKENVTPKVTEALNELLNHPSDEVKKAAAQANNGRELGMRGANNNQDVIKMLAKISELEGANNRRTMPLTNVINQDGRPTIRMSGS